MYRQSLKKMADTDTLNTTNPEIISRVANYPIVSAAIGQISSAYQTTKDSHAYIKYTLETAESGVKVLASTAQPIVNKLEPQIKKVDNVACEQLDKIECKYPLITKPTEVWAEKTKEVYDANVKPTVDRVNATKDYGLEQVTAYKTMTTNKIASVRQYSLDTVEGVKTYSTDKLVVAKNYSQEKVNDALATPYGLTALNKIDQALSMAEGYLDYYLPEEESEKNDSEKVVEGEPMECNGTEQSTLTHAVSVSEKARRRMYSRAMRDLKSVQMRTTETLEKLNFTIDLIAYAKSNLDGVQTRVAAVPAKLREVWDQVNKTDEEVEQAALTTEQIKDANSVTFERRAIATARHLTMKLKAGVAQLQGMFSIFPESINTRVTEVKKYTDDLYNSFATAESFKELPQLALDQAKVKVTGLQESWSGVYTFVQNLPIINWLFPKTAAVEDQKETETIEMNTIKTTVNKRPAQEPTETPKEDSPAENDARTEGDGNF